MRIVRTSPSCGEPVSVGLFQQCGSEGIPPSLPCPTSLRLGLHWVVCPLAFLQLFSLFASLLSHGNSFLGIFPDGSESPQAPGHGTQISAVIRRTSGFVSLGARAFCGTEWSQNTSRTNALPWFLCGRWNFISWAGLNSALSLPNFFEPWWIDSVQKKTFWAVQQCISWPFFLPALPASLSCVSCFCEGILSSSWQRAKCREYCMFPSVFSCFHLIPLKVSRWLNASFKGALALAGLSSCPLHSPRYTSPLVKVK